MESTMGSFDSSEAEDQQSEKRLEELVQDVKRRLEATKEAVAEYSRAAEEHSQAANRRLEAAEEVLAKRKQAAELREQAADWIEARLDAAERLARQLEAEGKWEDAATVLNEAVDECKGLRKAANELKEAANELKRHVVGSE